MNTEILKYDSNFTEATFLTKADHVYMMILDAVMDRDLKDVKHYLSESVYNNLNIMVTDYINRNVIRIFNETNVKTSSISSINIDSEKITITVDLISRYMDYFINEAGDFISGVNDHRIEKNHRIVFTKKIDFKELNEAHRCPSCGHSLDINHSGICPYCGSTIDMSNYDYVITEIDSI